MDIDLLFTGTGEPGLIASENFVKKIAGVLFDTASGIATLEYVDMDYLEMNIPVEADFAHMLDSCRQVHIGAVKNGHIAQAYQAPLMLLDDPYRGTAAAIRQPANPLVAFERFVRRCRTGQPLHRADLGNEERTGCVLGDAVPAQLRFAPHLARRHALEAAPKMAPRGPGPAGPGLGGSSGGGYVSRSGGGRPPPSEDSE